jgi:glycosyltransferase involved in cell wall biosynthesis
MKANYLESNVANGIETMKRGEGAKCRVAIYIDSLRGGGVEAFTVRLASALVERGIQVDLVAAELFGPNLGFVHPAVRLVDLKSKRVVLSLPPLVRYLRDNTPDYLISAMDHVNLLALFARSIAGVSTKVIISTRTMVSVATRNSPVFRQKFIPRLMRIAYPYADHIVAISKGVAEDLAGITGLPRTRIKVIYNFLDLQSIQALSEADFNHPWFREDQPPVIVSSGRLVPAKDYSTLLRAFQIVTRETSTRLIILGEGRERATLEALIKELNLDSKVGLPGFIDNPYPYVARAGLFVLSSAWEGLSNVLIEALACGTSIVSTDCKSGPSEILQGGALGVLVPVGDYLAMAEAMIKVLKNPMDPERLILRAQDFSVENNIDNYLAMLE